MYLTKTIMKKIFLVVAFALVAFGASAWNQTLDEGVVVLATKHLSPEAKSMVEKYLGTSYADDVQYLTNLEKKKIAKHSKEIHYLHLDSELRPMKVEGDDALMALENAIAVVSTRDSHSKEDVVKALRTMINLMCDIHNFSYVRIDGIPHSQQEFTFKCYGGDVGKRKTTNKVWWLRFWTAYGGWHIGFSGNLWAEDLELCHGKQREEFAAGSLQDWVAQIATEASNLYSRIQPEYEMTRRERNELEYLNYEMVARAGYRLSKLLNELAK